MRSLTQLFCACLVGTALATPASAQRLVTVFTDGAWVQVTAGQGTDNIAYEVALDKIPANGNWAPEDVKRWIYPMGTYNDHGGPGNQEVRKANLARFQISPGDAVEIVIGAFAQSNGGFFESVWNGVKGLVGQAAKESALYSALAAGGSAAAQGMSDAMKQSEFFAGAVRITVLCDKDGNVTWSYGPLDFATDRGKNRDPDVYRVDFKRQRGEYWFKFGVQGATFRR
jgi:hypothetical protein